MPTDHRARRPGAILIALILAALATPLGVAPTALAASPPIVDPDPPAPEPTPVPGVEPTVAPPAGATAPDGVPLGGRPVRSSVRETDLPAPGDPALTTATTPTTGTEPSASCSTTNAISTGDGSMQLAFSSTGAIIGAKAGSRCLERLVYSGGFSARLAGGQPNLLANASFDSGTSTPTSWLRSGSGPVSQATETHAGTRAVQISRTTVGTSGDLHQTVRIATNTNYVLSGWFKSVNVKPTSGAATNPVVTKDVSPLEIQAIVKDSGGRVLPGDYRAYGYTDTADWNFQSVGFRTPSNAYSVTIYLRMKSGSGTGYFDSLYLSQLLAPSSVPTASSTISRVDPVTLSQSMTLTGQPLRIAATYTAKQNHIRIDGKVISTGTSSSVSTDDRALQVTFNLPVNATNWYWADYARRSRQIATGIRYEFDNHQTTPTSRYPWATVYDGGSAVSIGSPLSVPRGYTTRYDTRQGLTITFDLGVSRSAAKLDNAAPFSILLFTSDPTWGMRAATKKFYDIEPTSFVREYRADNQGIPFIQAGQQGAGLDTLDDPNTALDESKDFGLGLNLLGLGYNGEWGKQYLRWDDPRNISAVAYTHLWGDFRDRCPGTDANTCLNQTYDAYVASVRADATGPAGRTRDESAAALTNAAKDFNGRIRYDLSASRAEYRTFLNGDPDIPSTPTWAGVIQTHMLDKALSVAAEAPGTLEGIYIDSTSGFRQWGQVDDYDRSKWAVADAALYLSYASGRVAQRTFFNNYEQVKRTKAWVQARGMYLAMDYNAQELTEGGFLGADLPDYFVIENGLPDRDYPEWGVTMDSYAIHKRSMASQRPVGSVDEHGCKSGFPLNGSLGADTLRFRVQQSLFYGIYAGPCRWETTSWYTSAHRAIYKLFTPLFQRLGEAGWEPLTNARSDNTALWLERYGNLKDDDLNFALRNETSTTKTAKLTINLDNSYDRPVGTLTELKAKLQHQTGSYPSGPFSLYRKDYTTTGGTITLDASRSTATLTVSLPAYTTGVLRVRQP
jgi:hypothetical protein